MGIWSTQDKVEAIVLKAAWQWGSNSSIVNGPLGEPGRTQFYGGPPSPWGSVDGDHMFSPCFVDSSFTEDSGICQRKNKLLALEMEHLSP